MYHTPYLVHEIKKERHVSEELSPLEDTLRTDFEILKIIKHLIVFVAAAILQQ